MRFGAVNPCVGRSFEFSGRYDIPNDRNGPRLGSQNRDVATGCVSASGPRRTRGHRPHIGAAATRTRRSPRARATQSPRRGARAQGGDATRGMAGSGVRSASLYRSGPRAEALQALGSNDPRNSSIDRAATSARRCVCSNCWCCGLLGRRRTQAAIESMQKCSAPCAWLVAACASVL